MIEFLPLSRGDLPLVREWLSADHVRLWWRDPVESLAGYEAAIDGDDPTDLHLIALDGRLIGVIQTYLAVDHPDWEAVVRVGEGVASVDLMIGDPELVGHGLGPRILVEFVRTVVFARPETHACAATVEEANSRSWRAFEKAGFRHVRDVVEETDGVGVPHRLMWLDRESQEA
jgi:aminoglycoside 6'-N-acetyltransferase